MGCIYVLLALVTPRVFMFFIWILTDWFGRAYETTLWPLLGFIFMPYTTLAYMAAMLQNSHRVSGWWVVLVVVAVIADLSSSSEAGRHGKKRVKKPKAGE